MKIIPGLAAAAIMCTAFSVTAFASQSSVSADKTEISLSENQTEFETVISVTPDVDFAGVEIAVECPENVVLESSTGSAGSMSAAPTFANGFYWTSFFESDNILSGKLDITLTFSCTEDFDAGEVVLNEVKVYTKNGAGVDTEQLSPLLSVSVSRTSGSSESDTSSESASSSESSGTSSSAAENTDSSSNDSSSAGASGSSSAASGNSESTNSKSGSASAGGNSGSKKSDNTANPDTGRGILGAAASAGILTAALLTVKKRSK